MHALETSKNVDTLVATLDVPIWDRDPFLRIKEKVRAETMQLKRPDEEGEDEEES